MALLHLLSVAAGSLVAAAFFGILAERLARRPVDAGVRLPAAAFAIAWAALAFEALNDALRIAAAMFDAQDAYFALARMKIIAAAVAIWGLGTYVTYLWRGTTRGWSAVIGIFAVTHAFYFLYAFEQRNPIGVALGTWAPRIIFENLSPLPPPLRALSFPYFFLPPVLLALAYGFLLTRLEDRTQRYRVSMVALAIILFHIVNLFQSNPKVSPDSAIWPAIILLNMATGALAYAAYRPPQWIRRRKGIMGLRDESIMQRGGQPEAVAPIIDE